MLNDFNQKGHPMVFSDEATNTNELKDKCRAAIASLTRQHGLAERLAESCFMIALSELENGWQQRAEAAEAKLAASTAVKEVWKDRAWTAEEKLKAQVPDGWKLVPVEPTESMIVDGFESEPDEYLSQPEVWAAYKMMSGCQQAAYKARLCWAAMLAAAPDTESENNHLGKCT